MGIFKREFTSHERKMLNEAFERIAKTFRNHIENPDYVYRYFHATTQEQKRRVIRDMNEMTYVSCGIYKCATKWHPISWIGYGFCCPFLPGRGILIAERTFKEGIETLTEIVAHEFSHSQLYTIDGLMGEGIDSDIFEYCINDAWKWSSLTF